MLKWFRKYNKLILVVGCGVLMVAFLIPQAVTQFSPRPGDQVVATVDGEDVSQSDLREADLRLAVLEQMGLRPLAPYTREQWFLMLRDADAAGIGASDVEVVQALASLGLDPSSDELAVAAERLGQSPEALRAVVRDLLVAERYRMLASGHRFDSTAATLSSSPGLVSIQMLSEVRNFLRTEQAQQLGAAFLQQIDAQFQNSLEGTGRLSPPFVTAVLFDESERVGGALVVIEPEVTDEVRAGVTDGQRERLFTEYGGFLPGRGAPYPFGYRVPDRVKLEALGVSSNDVRATLSVGTVDVLEAVRAENPGVTPTEEQREATRNRLLDEATAAKVREIGSQLRGELESARRGVPTDAADRLVLEGSSYEAPSLETLADAVEAAHGVRPTITRRTDAYLTLDEAATLDGLALAGLPDLGLRFGQILGELPAFRPAPALVVPMSEDGEDPSMDPETPLVESPDPSPVAVQVGVPMPLLTSFLDGSLYLVRVTEADPAHEPASVDDVREQVTADAARVAAYEQLLDRKEELAAEAARSGLENLSAAGPAQDVPPFPRRTRRNSPDGRPAPPPLPEVGRAATLVDAAFEAVSGLGPDEAVDSLTARERVVAAGVDSRLALGVFRVDSLARPTRSDLARDIASGVLTGLDQTLLADGDQNPLSEDALRERLRFNEDG